MKRLFFFFFLLVLSGCNAGAGSKSIVLYHTSDIHGYILSEELSHEADEPKQRSGGFAAFANVLKKEKSPYLLFDSGDLFSGAPEGSLTKGKSVVALMNHLGYSAAAIGNHEFDQGADVVRALAKEAKFPLLGANIAYRHPRGKARVKAPEWAVESFIKEFNGVKIGVFGLITQDTPNVTMRRHVEHLKFLRPVNVAKEAVQKLKAQGAGIIIALTHIGFAPDRGPDFEDDKYLARNVPGIDVILGGHYHLFLREAYREPTHGAVIVHSGKYLKAASRLELFLDRHNKIINHAHRLIDLRLDETGEDTEVLTLVNQYKAQVDKTLGEVIGATEVALTASRVEESNLGNLLTDSLRLWAKADVAMHNGGGLRDNIPKGSITLRHLFMALPFDNTVVTLRLTGAQIKELLESSSGQGRSRLLVSGLVYSYDPVRPKGHRVLKVAVGGKPLALTRDYLVATNSFLADGGDGYDPFHYGRDKKDSGVLLRDVIADYIKENSPVHPAVEGRIRRESEPK